MTRRFLMTLIGALALSSIGCKYTAPRVFSLEHVEAHVDRLDWEFYQFFTDIDDIIFGIEPPPPPAVWDVYEN